MSPEEITDLIRLTIFVAAEISAPMLVTTLLIGLGVSIFQSVTQISETTLIFIPKLMFFALTFVLTLPWIIKIMIRFTYDILITHWNDIMSVANNAQ
jgi:flagellar biosynthesis protein FliQ